MTDLFNQANISAEYQCPTMDTFKFPSLCGPITIDTETHDPLLTERGAGWAYDRYGQNGGKVLGYAVHADNFHEYLPVGHVEGNMDPARIKSWLSHEINKDPSQPKIFANIMYDEGWMEAEGVKMTEEQDRHDVMYQAPLLDENRFNYGLDALGKDFLNVGKDERLLKEAADRLGVKNSKKDNVKKHLMRIHPNIVGVYANQDTFVTRSLWDHFTPLMVEQNLLEVYALEMDLVPMHIAMRMRGVRVNVEEAERRQRLLTTREKEARIFIKETTGIELGSWDTPAEIAKIFDKLEIKYNLTEKSKQPSITAGWLKSLNHPIADAILAGRKAANIRSTFIENSLLNLQQRGRVYPNFNQLRKNSDDGSAGVLGKELKSTSKGTVSGRYSSSNPNFQQMPSPERDYDTGMMIRELFLPEEGDMWHGLDYSSQEPRGIVHFAEVTNCRGAAKMADKFRDDPDTDIHMENGLLIIAKKPDYYGGDPKKARKPTKTIGLGIAYGMGGGKLALQLGLPYTFAKFMKGLEEFEYMKAGPEAQEIMNAFDDAAPYIRELAYKCQNAVKKKGYIVTPIGRRFRFPKDDSGRYMFLNKALNRLIQGTSADMTKLAMRNLWRAGILPLGTVHDEIDLSESDPKRVALAKEIMETALPMTIPIRVDVGTGKNWGDASVPDLGGENYVKFMERMVA